MRNVTRTASLVAAGALAASIAAVAPASAATETTFTLTAPGGLNISQPLSKHLGETTAGSFTLENSLGPVEVTDERAGVLGYNVTVVGTDFVHQDGTYKVEALRALYTPGPVDGTGNVLLRTPVAEKTPLNVEMVAVKVTGVTGNNTTAWDPTITVVLPTDALAGTYTGTVTHSLA